jgi:hypothetical protein
MEAKWYHTESKSAGPLSVAEIVNRIRQSRGQSHFVWTEGMSGWTEASKAAEFLTAFQGAQAGRAGSVGVMKLALPPSQETLAARARKELRHYLAISAYLYVCFAALLLYRTAILRGAGFDVTPAGLALVKALILGKFMLVLQTLRIGDDARGDGILLANILKKSLLFTFLLIVLTVIEEMIVGFFHGRTTIEVLSELAGGTIPQAFATGLLMFLILIPYFAYREIANYLGEGELAKLLTARRSLENAE